MYLEIDNRYLRIYNSKYELNWMLEVGCECSLVDKLPKKESNPSIIEIREDEPEGIEFMKLRETRQKQVNFYYDRLKDTLSKLQPLEENVKILEKIITEM